MAEFNFTTLSAFSTVLDTHLDSLATITGAVPVTAIDNSDGDFYADWAFSLASVDLTSQSNPAMRLYLLSSTDGGNTYEDGDANTEPARRPDAVFSLRDANEAQYVTERLILTPHDFKPLLFNYAGAALTTPNALGYAEYSTESN